MRIISGKFGGRRFNFKLPEGVRPTTDSSKETIYNILNNFDLPDEFKVLDIFAGSGSLGFEALSRGASKVTFVEKNPKVIEFIQKIANELKLDKNDYDIVRGDATKVLKRLEAQKFDLIFSDAPYPLNISNFILQQISDFTLLNENGIAVIEHATVQKIMLPSNFTLISEKKFGETTISFIGMQAV